MRRIVGRKLLIATIGLATVAYAACGNDTVANLIAPPGDAQTGNLMPPPDSGSDAQSDSASDATTDVRTDAPTDARPDQD